MTSHFPSLYVNARLIYALTFYVWFLYMFIPSFVFIEYLYLQNFIYDSLLTPSLLLGKYEGPGFQL